MASANPDYGVLTSLTLENYQKRLTSSVLDNVIVMKKIKEKGGVTTADGGLAIVEPLLLGENDTFESFQGLDLFNLNPQEGISAAKFNWKFYRASIVISNQDIFLNSGSSKVMDLSKAKIQQLEETAINKWAQQIFGDGTGNNNKDIVGLALMIEDGTAWSTYGGIDRSTTLGVPWRNRFLDFTGAGNTTFATAAGSEVEGIKVIRNMYNNCTIGADMPDLILTTQELFEEYEGHIEGDKLRIMDQNIAKLGFNSLRYKGADIVYDPNCPANTMYFMNTKYMKVVFGKNEQFKPGPFQDAPAQDGKVSLVTTYLAVTCRRPQVMGVITNFATT